MIQLNTSETIRVYSYVSLFQEISTSLRHAKRQDSKAMPEKLAIATITGFCLQNLDTC